MFSIRRDETYRHGNKHILIGMLENIIPIHGPMLPPNIYAAGTANYTWGLVREFFSKHPLARHMQIPFHYYAEYIEDDYSIAVGCPMTNRSWVLDMMVSSGVLNIDYADSILIILQESYYVENIEQRLYEHLSHYLLTPLLKDRKMQRSSIQFLEEVMIPTNMTAEYPFRYKPPRFLDRNILDMYLKEFYKKHN